MTVALNSNEPKSLVTLKPETGWANLHLEEIWQFRDLLITLAGRDVKLRYRQTALGAIWVVLQPLLAAGIMTFVFGKVAGLTAPGGLPYLVFAFAGQLGWGAFNGVFSRASTCLLQNTQLVSKVYFPRLVLPISTIFSALIDFLVALAMMVVLIIAYHVHPGLHLLLLPVWLAAIMLLAVGCGLITSALMVSYRDVQYIVPVLLNFLMYASPVAYSLQMVQEKVSPHTYTFFMLNPLSGLLEAFRWSLLGVGAFPVEYVTYSILAAVGVFLVGAVNFKRMERRFADVI